MHLVRREAAIAEIGHTACFVIWRQITLQRRRVDANPVPQLAAEQLVQRRIQRLALDVPQSDVNSTDGRHDV